MSTQTKKKNKAPKVKTVPKSSVVSTYEYNVFEFNTKKQTHQSCASQ